MSTLYNVLSYLTMPWTLLRLLYKSIALPAYRYRIRERYGFVPRMEQCIWFHAVSVGETIAAQPLIEKCLQNYPDIPVLVTNMTPAGSDRTQAMFGSRVKNVYVPYDVPGVVKRFLKRVNPRVLILIETELWPNLLNYTHKRNTPILLVNARLSERSAKGYARFSAVTAKMMKQLRFVAVQTVDEADRFIQLGLPKENISVVGSVKYDVTVSELLINEGHELRAQIGVNRPVWIAASTHSGEEEQVLDAFTKLLKTNADAFLILVPRHPQRFNEVAAMLAKRNFIFVKRSEKALCDASTQVLLGDTMGEMLLLIAAADIAFVGGSFANIGGHNSLEPASLGKPVLQGPISHNFVEITRLLKEAGALLEVKDGSDLGDQLVTLFDDSSKQAAMAEAGKAVVKANRGSVDKQFVIIQKHL